MKFIIRGSFLLLLLGALISCGNVLHNGTEMYLKSIEVTGLPTSIYNGTKMVFSYDTGGGWIHDKYSEFESGKYSATVDANGRWFLEFDGLGEKITTASVTFLIVDQGKNWDTTKIDKKHSGKGGGDVILDNTWGGAGAPAKFKGVVNGDNVEWTVE